MDGEKPNKKNKIIIAAIIIVFTGPVILSWLIFNHTNFLDARGTSNYGQIINPPIVLEDFSLIDPTNLERKNTLYGKWSMIFVAESCDEICMENVYRMRQIHMGIGKHSLRVQKVLFLTNQHPGELSKLLEEHKECIIRIIYKYNGSIIKGEGDAFLISFSSSIIFWLVISSKTCSLFFILVSISVILFFFTSRDCVVF